MTQKFAAVAFECSAPRASPETFDGIYTGKRLLTNGSASPTCPFEDDVSVKIAGKTLTFTDSRLKNGFTMPFYPGADGSFGSIYTGEGSLHYHGRIVRDVMDVDVNISDCEHHWHLKKG